MSYVTGPCYGCEASLLCLVYIGPRLRPRYMTFNRCSCGRLVVMHRENYVYVNDTCPLANGAHNEPPVVHALDGCTRCAKKVE